MKACIILIFIGLFLLAHGYSRGLIKKQLIEDKQNKFYAGFKRITIDAGTGGIADPGNAKELKMPELRKLLETAETTTTIANDGEETIEEFFDDPHNRAMYIVLPLLVLVYGGCSMIYCVHRCLKYAKKRKRKKMKKEEAKLTRNNIQFIRKLGLELEPGRRSMVNVAAPVASAGISAVTLSATDQPVREGSMLSLPGQILDEEEEDRLIQSVTPTERPTFSLVGEGLSRPNSSASSSFDMDDKAGLIKNTGSPDQIYALPAVLQSGKDNPAATYDVMEQMDRKTQSRYNGQALDLPCHSRMTEDMDRTVRGASGANTPSYRNPSCMSSTSFIHPAPHVPDWGIKAAARSPFSTEMASFTGNDKSSRRKKRGRLIFVS